MSSDELRRILETFNTDLFRDQVDRARELIDFEDVSTDDSSGPVPTKSIEDIYGRRSETPGAPQYIKSQCAKVAYLAGRFPEECWNIFGLDRGNSSFVIFANAAGIGRACIDVTKYDVPEAPPTSTQVDPT